jgi:periplasmic mercuric ion binding protein
MNLKIKTMKTKSVLMIACLLFLGMISTFANGAKTEKIKIYGNCGQCKTRIEKAANSLQGVTKATWVDKDEILTVTFDDTKTSVSKIEQAVAKVGHDTDHAKATDKAYNALPVCCKYDRPAIK